MENTSKAFKFVNHGFHIIKTYSHIPGTFLTLLVYTKPCKKVDKLRDRQVAKLNSGDHVYINTVLSVP
jgi:hypothetical protein